jgi:hypothetical protein
MVLHEHEKKSNIKNKNKLKGKMESLKVLPLHWFFINDSTTKTSSIKCEKKLVSKSKCFAQI